MKSISIITLFIAMLAPIFALRFTSAALNKKPVSTRSLSMAGSFYDISEKDANGNLVSFSKFKGKVVYGVNVASKCGYTASGYALLSKLSKLENVEVALFPCNQFGGQEPGSDKEVAQFCALKGVEGANVFTKADVNGPNTRPTYKFIKEKLGMGDIAWNFAGKFIVDTEGNVLPVKSEKSLEADITKLAAK
jgi:glutathione peroxidase